MGVPGSISDRLVLRASATVADAKGGVSGRFSLCAEAIGVSGL